MPKVYIIRWHAANGESGLRVSTELPKNKTLWMMTECAIMEVEPTGKGWNYNPKRRRLESMLPAGKALAKRK